jgi:hypothetical protein
MQRLTFKIDKFKTLEDINNDQLMILELWIVSEGDNAHRLPIPRNAIIESASSIIGKPVLYKYSEKTDDLMAHEVDEISCGVTALNKADYCFREDDEGKLWLVCRAYVWKIYYPEIVEIFTRDEKKAISMEILIVGSDAEEGEEAQEILSFSFTGITLLGDIYQPAIKNAKAIVEKFSDPVKETERLLYTENLISNIDITINTEKEDEEVANIPEFNKKDFAISYNYTVFEMLNQFDKQCTATYTEDYCGSKYEYTKYACRDFCKDFVYVSDRENGQVCAVPYSKDLKMDFEAVKECRMTYVVDDGESEDSEGTTQMVFTKKEMGEYLEKANEINTNLKSDNEAIQAEKLTFTTEITELKAEIENLKATNTDLTSFKDNVIQQEREQGIKFAIDSVSEDLTKDQIKEWSNKAKDYENVDAFKNAIQAFAFSQTKQSNKEPKNLRIAVPGNNIEDTTKKGLWD